MNRVEVYNRKDARFEAMSQERLLEVIHRARAGDRDARDKIVYGHMWLVILVAEKIAWRVPTVTADDLVTEGAMALLKAIKKYEGSKAKFTTYAERCIRLTMLKSAQSCRSMLSLTHQAKELLASGRYHFDYHRLQGQGLTTFEIIEWMAKTYEMGVEAVSSMVAAALPSFSLDALRVDGRSLQDVVPHRAPKADDQLAHAQWRANVQTKLRGLELSPREREIMERRLYAVEEESFAQIGADAGVSKQRIKQNEDSLIRKLRVTFAEDWSKYQELTSEDA